MTQRTTFAALLLFISIVTLLSLYGWVTAVPAYQEPVAIPIVIDQENWSAVDSPLLELPTSDGDNHPDGLDESILIRKTDHSP